MQKGQAGLYIITDPKVEAKLKLPTGSFDIPLIFASKQYNMTTGAVLPPTLPGDTIEVNGQLYPYLDVDPRKYRFRILNGAATRTFDFRFFINDTMIDPIPFHVVASDSGYLPFPVSTRSLNVSMGERYEIVMDFKKYAGQRITIRNNNALTSPTLGQAMQFIVGTILDDDTNNGVLPTTLRRIEPIELPTTSAQTFTFAFTK